MSTITPTDALAWIEEHACELVPIKEDSKIVWHVWLDNHIRGSGDTIPEATKAAIEMTDRFNSGEFTKSERPPNQLPAHERVTCCKGENSVYVMDDKYGWCQRCGMLFIFESGPGGPQLMMSPLYFRVR